MVEAVLLPADRSSRLSRYVARGVPGGYRIWDNKARRWWGDLYELNGAKDYATITALLKRYRALKR
jgi:hypothetical protein